MMYSKRRTNLGRRSKKSSNRKLKRSNRLHMRGGTAEFPDHCPKELITNPRFMVKDERATKRAELDKHNCRLADLKGHLGLFKLHWFGFTIKELLDAGFSIYKLLKVGLDDEIYTEFNSMNDDDKHKVVEFIKSTTDLPSDSDSKKVPDLNLAKKFPHLNPYSVIYISCFSNKNQIFSYLTS
jgi:hypothetical protein